MLLTIAINYGILYTAKVSHSSREEDTLSPPCFSNKKTTTENQKHLGDKVSPDNPNMKTHRIIVLSVCILLAIIANSRAGIQALHPTGEKLLDGTNVAVVVDSTDKTLVGTKTSVDLSGYATPMVAKSEFNPSDYGPKKWEGPLFFGVIIIFFAALVYTRRTPKVKRHEESDEY